MKVPDPIPPIQNPPREWPLAARLESHRKWVELQGGKVGADPDAPPEALEAMLGIHCQLCAGEEIDEKPLREYFDPPLPVPLPEDIPAADIPRVLKEYVDLLESRGFVAEFCAHRAPAENLWKVLNILDEDVEDPGRGAVHFQLMMDCEECRKEWDEDALRTDLAQPIYTELSALWVAADGRRVVLDRLDRETAEDEESTRDRLIRLPGEDRTLALIFCVMDRLRTDMGAGPRDILKDLNRPAVKALRALRSCVKAMDKFDDGNDAAGARRDYLAATRAALDVAPNIARFPSCRLFKDIARMARDFRAIAEMLAAFIKAAKSSPKPPDPDTGTERDWESFYYRKTIAEEPMIADVESRGLSAKSLLAGYRRMMKTEKTRSGRRARWIRHAQLLRRRDRSFDPNHPESFLDATGTDFAAAGTEIDSETPGEIRLVNLSNEDPPADSDTSAPRRKRRRQTEPTDGLIEDFFDEVFRLLKEHRKFTTPDTANLECALHHHIALWILKCQAWIASRPLIEETASPAAVRRGLRRFVARACHRIAESINLAPDPLLHIAHSARQLRRTLLASLRRP